MTAFNPGDSSTWAATLTAEQVAAIYQRPILGLKKACQKGKFSPMPFQKQPYRWRKADVLRDVESGRAIFPVQRSA